MNPEDATPLYPSTATIQFKETSRMNTSPQAPMSQFPAPVPHLLLGPENTVTVCPLCRASIKTAVKHTVTSRTHLTAAICGILCCMCCLPYWSDSAKNTDHYCPNCQKYIGTYEK